MSINIKIVLTVFAYIFIAEMGDKTQLATMIFSANKNTDKLSVFLGSAIALTLTSAIGVIAGTFLSKYINEKYLNYIAGIGFVIIGLWTIYKT